MFFYNDALSPVGNGLGPDEWWKGAVVYQIYPCSFKDSNGDDTGDLEGIRSKLDYLQALGVDALRFFPIHASPRADNGCDIADYYDIGPMLGILSGLGRLPEDVHERGMRLVMDLVVDHSSGENPWFIESRSSWESPKRDWHVWCDPRLGCVSGDAGAEPNNQGPFFSGSAWARDEATDQYYLHLFHKKQPDLNWKNPQVCAAVYEMMNQRLDHGVGDFRMNVVNPVSKGFGLPDGVVYPRRTRGEGFPHSFEGPHPHECLTGMRCKVFDSRTGAMMVGECPGVRHDSVLLLTDPAWCEPDAASQFDHIGLGLEAEKFHPRPLCPGELAGCLTQWQETQGEVDWNSFHLDNHGQPCVVSRFGDEVWRYESVTTLATALHMLHGTPHVYQGGKLGMTNSAFGDISDYRDVGALCHYREAVESGESPKSVLKGLAFAGRGNARTPVQWDTSKNADFTQDTPQVGITPNYRNINAASQVDDPSSVYVYYRVLADIRHGPPVIAVGVFERIAAPSPATFVYRRALGEAVATVLASLSSQSVPLGEAAHGVSGDLLLANCDLSEGDRGALETPGEWKVLVYIH